MSVHVGLFVIEARRYFVVQSGHPDMRLPQGERLRNDRGDDKIDDKILSLSRFLSEAYGSDVRFEGSEYNSAPATMNQIVRPSQTTAIP